MTPGAQNDIGKFLWASKVVRQVWSHGGKCITQQALSLLREGGAEGNEMHIILPTGITQLAAGVVGSET